MLLVEPTGSGCSKGRLRVGPRDLDADAEAAGGEVAAGPILLPVKK